MTRSQLQQGPATDHYHDTLGVDPAVPMGGGVSVDNGVDAPASVTTLVAPGADVSVSGEATLGDVFPPPPWTVDEHGTLTIQPDDLNAACLVLKDNGGNIIATFGQVAATSPYPPFSVGSGSDVVIGLGDTGSFGVVTDAGTGLGIGADGSTTVVVGPGVDGLHVRAPATDPPYYLFALLDSDLVAVFGIQSDGTVHIKTGTSIVADL